uniref:Uncharacterized protein n=1 Tax=Lactuca sativa TaxID=4236 RepID=A0A9R1UMT3_LACSA|nr:hypothetical protein LSAT_V11C800399000 [Lactuca sativa]
MFKSRYAPLVCDWDAEDHKASVNNLANLHGALTCYSHLFDVPEYEEKYETIINNVSTEKDNMEDIILHCLSKFSEDNRTKEMIRKFRDIFSTTLFSSREKGNK